MDHKAIAIELFNNTWNYIDMETRSKDKELKMIHMAHASMYHWSEVGSPINFARGEWLISRVYSIINNGAQALYHGRSSLDYCLENEIKDFDLAFAYESLARAYFLLSDKESYTKYYKLAEEASLNISSDDDKAYFMSELASIES